MFCIIFIGKENWKSTGNNQLKTSSRCHSLPDWSFMIFTGRLHTVGGCLKHKHDLHVSLCFTKTFPLYVI